MKRSAFILHSRVEEQGNHVFRWVRSTQLIRVVGGARIAPARGMGTSRAERGGRHRRQGLPIVSG
jgi:hypothetical protein